MKNYEEVTHDLLERRDRYVTEQKRKRKRMMGVVTSFGCFCLVALLGVGVWCSGMLTPPKITLENNSTISYNHGDGDYTTPGNQDGEQSNPPTNSQGNNPSNPAVTDPPVTSQTTPNNSSNPSGDTPSSNDQSGGQSNPPANSQEDNPPNPVVTDPPVTSQTTPNNPSNPGDNPSSDSGGNPGGNPNAVMQSKVVSYQEAKDLFAHPIVECFDSNFINYEIIMVSQKGDWDGFYFGVKYIFSDGQITLIDQDRMNSFVFSVSYLKDKLEYNGHTFFVTKENYLSDSQSEIWYSPKMENDFGVGIVYSAHFDQSVDQAKIMDLILSLEIK